jgi:FkbM family methyltransferase
VIKNLIIKFFVNSLCGFIIKKFNFKFNLHNGIFDYTYVNNLEAASIFFGIWESAEIRFAKRFAKSKIIVELGSCVGVTFGVLANILDKKKFICVEASKKNYLILKKLSKLIPKKENLYFFLNNAIYYDSSYVNFQENTSITSKITPKNLKTNKSYKVKTLKLIDVIKMYSIKEPFTLISDIEGAEVPIFFEDRQSLKLCEMIIVELENTPLKSIKKQVMAIKKIGFKLLEFYGNVYVFESKTKFAKK